MIITIISDYYYYDSKDYYYYYYARAYPNNNHYYAKAYHMQWAGTWSYTITVKKNQLLVKNPLSGEKLTFPRVDGKILLQTCFVTNA